MTSLRIFRVTYITPKHGQRPRRARVYVKVPYGGAFAMSEVLTRMVSVGQLERFEVAAARPGEITPDIRAALQRWLPALTNTSSITGVDWTT